VDLVAGRVRHIIGDGGAGVERVRVVLHKLELFRNLHDHGLFLGGDGDDLESGESGERARPVAQHPGRIRFVGFGELAEAAVVVVGSKIAGDLASAFIEGIAGGQARFGAAEIEEHGGVDVSFAAGDIPEAHIVENAPEVVLIDLVVLGAADDQVVHQVARRCRPGPGRLQHTVDVHLGGGAVEGAGDMDPGVVRDHGVGGAEDVVHPCTARDGRAQGAAHPAGGSVEGDVILIPGALFQDAAPALVGLVGLHPEFDGEVAADVQGRGVRDRHHIVEAVEGEGVIGRRVGRAGGHNRKGSVAQVDGGAGVGFSDLDPADAGYRVRDRPFIDAQGGLAGGKRGPGGAVVGREVEGHQSVKVLDGPGDGMDAAHLPGLAAVGLGHGDAGRCGQGFVDGENGVADIHRGAGGCGGHLDQAGVGVDLGNRPLIGAGIGDIGGDASPLAAVVEAVKEVDVAAKVFVGPGDVGLAAEDKGLSAVGGGDENLGRRIDDLHGLPGLVHRAVAILLRDPDMGLVQELVRGGPEIGAVVGGILGDQVPIQVGVVLLEFDRHLAGDIGGDPLDLVLGIADDARMVLFGRLGDMNHVDRIGAIPAGIEVVGDDDAVKTGIMFLAAEADGVIARGKVEIDGVQLGQDIGDAGGAAIADPVPGPLVALGGVPEVFGAAIDLDEPGVAGAAGAESPRPDDVEAGGGDGEIEGADAGITGDVLGGEDEFAAEGAAVDTDEHAAVHGCALALFGDRAGDEAGHVDGDVGVAVVKIGAVSRIGDAIEQLCSRIAGDDCGIAAGVGRIRGQQIPLGAGVEAEKNVDMGEHGVDRPGDVQWRTGNQSAAVGGQQAHADGRGGGDPHRIIGIGQQGVGAERGIEIVGGCIARNLSRPLVHFQVGEQAGFGAGERDAAVGLDLGVGARHGPDAHFIDGAVEGAVKAGAVADVNRFHARRQHEAGMDQRGHRQTVEEERAFIVEADRLDADCDMVPAGCDGVDRRGEFRAARTEKLHCVVRAQGHSEYTIAVQKTVVIGIGRGIEPGLNGIVTGEIVEQGIVDHQPEVIGPVKGQHGACLPEDHDRREQQYRPPHDQ